MVGSGAGAGFEGNNTGNMLTPFSQSDEGFSVVPGEQVGQLYAYRINASAVILGTRRASVFGASIGIGAVAGGKYRCLAENAIANSRLEISIDATGKPSLRIHYSILFDEANSFFFHRSKLRDHCIYEVVSYAFQHDSAISEPNFIQVCYTDH